MKCERRILVLKKKIWKWTKRPVYQQLHIVTEQLTRQNRVWVRTGSGLVLVLDWVWVRTGSGSEPGQGWFWTGSGSEPGLVLDWFWTGSGPGTPPTIISLFSVHDTKILFKVFKCKPGFRVFFSTFKSLYF